MAYILLALIGTGVFLFTLTSVPLRPLIATTAAMGASVGLTDLLIVGILKLYVFRPHLMANPIYDNFLGLLLADYIFVPLLYGSLLMLAPRYRTAVSAVFVAALTLIELFFLRQGIFFHQGWKLWYTAVTFAARCGIAVWWLPIFERKGYTRVFRALIVGASLFYLWSVRTVVTVGIVRFAFMRLGWFEPETDIIVGGILLHGIPFLLLTLACVGFAGVSKRYRWAFAVAAFWLYLAAIRGMGLWRVRAPWSPLADAVVCGTLAVAVAALDAWYMGTERPAARV